MTNQRKKTKSIFEKTPFLSKFVSFNFLNWFSMTINIFDICFLCWFENLDALEGKDNKILWKKAVINNFIKNIDMKILSFLQGRKTKFAFPLYTVETGTKFRSRFHCIQGKRKFRFSSLLFCLSSLLFCQFFPMGQIFSFHLLPPSEIPLIIKDFLENNFKNFLGNLWSSMEILEYQLIINYFHWFSKLIFLVSRP